MAHKFAYWQWVKDTFVTKSEVNIYNLDVSNIGDRLADAEDKTGQALREVGSKVSLAEYQERIANLQQDLDAAEASLSQASSELSAAQQLINNAFDQIDLKPDQAYVDAAKQQAIDAAAIDAQARAEAAAQQIQDNLEQAELDLQAAITSGDQNAIAQAQIKADAARQAAIDAAAADATAKADAARQAAITAAASDATAKAAEAMSKANQALSAAQSAQATADNAIRTYYAETPPWANGSTQPDDVLGDMWFKNSTGQAYRWNGTSWGVIVDQTIGQALAAAQTAQTTADGKITAFYQDSAPVEADEGDLWFDTDDGNKLYRRAGSSWVSVADARLAMQAGEITALQSDLAGVAGRTDGKANIYYQNTPPANMTSADKGDVWIDTTSGRVVKVWSGAAWVEADSRTASTLASVNTKITTYYQSDAPPTTGRTAGDLWVDSDDQSVWRWSGSAWVKAMDPASLADAARQAAIQAAAADATAKAEQAEADAAAAAAADATTKANAAKAAAEQAAQIYADQVAAGAGASALSSAKTYAEQKAEAARVAAEAAAAADATAKAEAAEAAAAATAAADATAKANAAELAAKSAAAADATTKANQAETNAKNAAQAWVDAAKATALKSVVVEYAVGSSETVAPTSGWSTSTPTRTPGTFIWYRSIATRGDDTSTTSSPALLTGNKGDAGAPAQVVTVTANSQLLVSPAAGGATTPATATVTGTAVNTTITAWTYSINNGAFSATVPAGVSRSGNTVTITGSTMTASTIAVKMADAAGVSDTLTVAKVSHGAGGGAGSPGADAYTVLLTNEAHVFAGSTTAALAGSTTSAVIAYKGATQMAATVGTITGQVTGLTTSVASNGGTAPVITVTVTTALTTKNGTLTVPVTVDGKTFTKTIAWSVANQGTTGATGVSLTSVTPYFRTVTAGAAAPAAPTGATPASPWQSTEPAYAANLDLYRSDRIVLSSGTATYTPVTLVSSYTAAKAAETNAKAFATTQVNGVSKSYWSTALPGTTQAAKDSTWYRHDASGKIIAVFNQTAAGIGATWTARPITSEAIDNLDVGKLSVSGSSTLQQAVINQMAVQLANIITARIENLTVTETSQLNTVVAQRIASNVGEFVSIIAQQITGGQITAAIGIATGGAIVAGDPDGARVEMTSDGVRVYVIGPNGAPYEAVSMVNGEISFAVVGQDGSHLGGISADGSVDGTSGAFSKDVTIMGRPVIGRLRDGGGSATLPGWLDNLPRGIISKTTLANTSDSGVVATGTEASSMGTTVRVYPDRQYRVVAGARFSMGMAGGVTMVRIRHAASPNRATITSPTIGLPGYTATSASTYHAPHLEASALYTPPVEQVVNFRMTFQGYYGATPKRTGGYIYVEDVGPVSPDFGVDDTDNLQVYQATWKATASREYNYNGATLRDGGSIDIWYWADTARESVAWIYGGGAVEASQPTELGKTLPQALTGATLQKVEIYVHNKLWWDSRVTSARIAVNTLASATLPTTKLVEGALWGPEIPEGQGAWFEVPTTWFTNGANRGITMGDRDAVMLGEFVTSGVFHGVPDQNPPMLRATYIR